MPLCHFAFGSLHRANNLKAQVDAFIENILIPKQLKAFSCPEFLPIINRPGAMLGVPDSAVVTEDGAMTFTSWVKSPPVGLLPCDVWMISFVDVPFKKLAKWVPSTHYGKLGIAFTDAFRRRNQIKNVRYYQLRGLEKDPLVARYNRAIVREVTFEADNISKILLGYRKPAVLWPEFEQLFAMIKFTAGPQGAGIEKLTYSRYATGYKFHEEHEARWITADTNHSLPFSESDVLKIIVPNSEIGDIVNAALNAKWSGVHIMVYPDAGRISGGSPWQDDVQA